MDVVTGAFSFTGRAIAEELLERGRNVRTLARREAPGDPLAARIERAELQFRDEEGLRRALDGIDTLFNTYWVRFAHGATTFDRAVENTRVLLRAAPPPGSGAWCTSASPTPHPSPRCRTSAARQRRKRTLPTPGVSYAIVRPTLVFGPRDILVNNIAWGLRRSPVFPIAGDGSYRVQPVSVEDTAAVCVDAAAREDDVVFDAAGPETISYDELVRLVAAAVGSRARIVHWPDRLVLALARATGTIRRDVLLTAEELAGLRASLLVSELPPLGRASFRSWVAANGEVLGRGYVSELARNFRPYDPI